MLHFVGRMGRRLLFAATFVLLVLVAGTALLTPDCRDEGCPTLANVREYVPPEPPHVYDRNGRLVGQLPGPRRLVVPLAEIPELVREGFIAVEDRRFRSHGGVDVLGIARAVVANLRAASAEEGASTITMQLVRNVFEADVLDYNKWRRKLTEARMAMALEDRLSKDEILELYLNQIYLGGGTWGVETAARSFFGKSVSEVTPGEAALLVGMAKNPEGYNPRRDMERALERRSLVLGIWVQEGVLPPWEADEARAEEIRLDATPDARRTGAYYMAAVDRRIRALFPDPRARNGLRISTGYDPVLQEAATTSLRDQIEAVEAGFYGAFPHDAPASRSVLAAVEEGASPYLQGAVISLDARTGQVRALVGGRDFPHSQFDRAFQAERQPGSAFKPIVYAAALGRGLTLSEEIPTDPVTVHQAGRAPWSPRDAGDGSPLSVRQALARSSNTAAVRVGQRAGVENVTRLARELGISSTIPSYPSVFLGSVEVVPAELVAAYAPFGNGGMRVTPHLVTRIEDRDGNLLWEPEDVTPRPVLDPGVAYLTLQGLRGVVDDGTGWRVREAGFYGAAAGKTGTTDDGRDAWFVGMTPDVVTGVWLGFDSPRPILPDASGGALAAPVWGRMMRALERVDPAGGWSRPDNVAAVPIDTSSGLRANEHCPVELVAEELFLEGTEPREYCPVHEAGFFDKVLDGIQRIIRLGGDGGNDGGS